jgi:hypothetical protein
MGTDLLGGRYRLESLAGRGGMALVFRAWDELLERPVAVKVLAENLAADEAFVSRFRLEARSAARLCHPNIVQVFDACEEDGRHAIVMEYVAGPTLAEELTARGTLPPDEVIEVGLEVCAGLRYAHDAGLVHRDLKPANLLRTPEGTVKIADFGIARLRDGAGLTQTGSIMGTAPYIPPEVAAGEDAGPAGDVYSLGAALYVLLALRRGVARAARPPAAELAAAPLRPGAGRPRGPRPCRRALPRSRSAQAAGRGRAGPVAPRRVGRSGRSRAADGAARRGADGPARPEARPRGRPPACPRLPGAAQPRLGRRGLPPGRRRRHPQPRRHVRAASARGRRAGRRGARRRVRAVRP